MKRIIVDVLLILICFLLQCTVFQMLSLAHIAPNLLIVLTSSYGFMRGKKSGLITGFVCGLLMDIFFNDYMGFYALIYMCIGYMNGYFHAIFYDVDIKLPMILITGSDLLYGVIIYLFFFLMRNRLDFPYYLLHVILPEVIYTVVVTILFYRLILSINRRLDTIKKRSDGRIVE